MKSALKKEWNYEAAYELPQAANANKPQEYDHKDFMKMLEDMKKKAETDLRFFLTARFTIPFAISSAAYQLMSSASSLAANINLSLEGWAKVGVIAIATGLAYGIDYIIARKIHNTGNVFNKAAEYYKAESFIPNAHKFPADVPTFEKHIENEAKKSRKYECHKDKSHLLVTLTVVGLTTLFCSIQGWKDEHAKKEVPQSVSGDVVKTPATPSKTAP